MIRLLNRLRVKNYWAYSIGSGIAWAVTFMLMLKIRGKERAQLLLLVIFGWCIGWVSETIARYIYPPPKRWTTK